VEFWLVTQVEAEQNPVGEGQREPNRDPYLPNPKRNLPPWAIGSKGLLWLQQRKMLIICLCVSLVLLPVLVPFVITQMSGSVF